MIINLDTSSRTFRHTFTLSLLAFSVILFGAATYSWTGPSGTAPNANVSAPINVGTTSQIKDGALSVDGLSVYGGQYIQGNLGIGHPVDGTWKIVAAGSSHAIYGVGTSHGVYGQITGSGYAIRGSAPTGGGYGGYFSGYGGVYSENTSGYYTFLNYPGSSWSVYSYGNTYASGYARADGGFCIGGSCKSSWAPSQTYVSASCSAGSSGGFCTATTANCPSGYVRSGCSGSGAAGPYSSNACQCTGAPSASCVTYCVQ